MSRFRIHESLHRTYLADAAALKAEFPTEYADFLESAADTSDQAWVSDCIDSGGFELLELTHEDWDVEIEATS